MLALARDVSRVLGLENATHWSDLERRVQTGLPKGAAKRVFVHVYPRAAEAMEWVYRIIPSATYKRRRGSLSPAESEKVGRFARVIAAAERVFDDQADARRFLVTAHDLLDGKTPLEAAMSEMGAVRVEELLMRAVYGIPV
jgi:putative toxin-antitoxin system antitoxin component (TIGR02293 family)